MTNEFNNLKECAFSAKSLKDGAGIYQIVFTVYNLDDLVNIAVHYKYFESRKQAEEWSNITKAESFVTEQAES